MFSNFIEPVIQTFSDSNLSIFLVIGTSFCNLYLFYTFSDLTLLIPSVILDHFDYLSYFNKSDSFGLSYLQ